MRRIEGSELAGGKDIGMIGANRARQMFGSRPGGCTGFIGFALGASRFPLLPPVTEYDGSIEA
jgi:hypothetical protein